MIEERRMMKIMFSLYFINGDESIFRKGILYRFLSLLLRINLHPSHSLPSLFSSSEK
jgi:hypothetical protein